MREKPKIARDLLYDRKNLNYSLLSYGRKTLRETIDIDFGPFYYAQKQFNFDFQGMRSHYQHTNPTPNPIIQQTDRLSRAG